MSTRDRLAEYLEGQAKWRELKAEEFPDDERNMLASDALAAAATEVLELPEDDSRLRKMDQAGWLNEGVFSPGEHGREVVRRYGFGRASVGYLLDDLARAAEREDEARLGDVVDDIVPGE